MKLYNTQSRTKEDFIPIHEKTVKMYNCGPTVYGYAHIGNFASFLFADFLKRFLFFKGYAVKQIMNITDVGHLTSDSDEGEDKIIQEALKEGKTPQEIAHFFEDAFFADSKKLNIKRASHHPRATEHIDGMIEIVEKLIENDHAYENAGNVYFDTESFKNYGKLSGNTIKNLRSAARKGVVKDSHKKNPEDFVLWFNAPEEHLMKWKSPWSMGYPGWHLECSAMAYEYLGETIDIHTGGEDHIFPHHEAEIAQSEGAHNKPFANYWLHRRHIMVDDTKMSKSLGNIYTISDLEKKGFNPLVYRFFIFSTHYRSKADFSFENLEHAQKGLQRILDCVSRLQNITNDEGTNLEAAALLDKSKSTFEDALDDDLNTPKALATVFDLVRDINRFIENNKINRDEAQKLLELLKSYDEVIGVIFCMIEKHDEEIPHIIKELVAEREAARQNNDYETADIKRDLIQERGFDVKDTARGPEVFKK